MSSSSDNDLPSAATAVSAEAAPQLQVPGNAWDQAPIIGDEGGPQRGQVPAIPSRGIKSWHQALEPDFQSHIVHKIVQAILPRANPSAMRDKRVQNLLRYVRKIEGDMYETANSHHEYRHLLAGKLIDFQKKLEARKKQKLEEKQQQMLEDVRLVRQQVVVFRGAHQPANNN